MRRCTAFVLWLTCMLPCVTATADEWVVDTAWKPKPGDLAQVYAEGDIPVLAAKDIFGFAEFTKTFVAKDSEGLNGLVAKGQLGPNPTFVSPGAK